MRTNSTRIFESRIDDSVNHTINIDHNSFDEFMQILRSYTGQGYRIVCVIFQDKGFDKPLNKETYNQLNATHQVVITLVVSNSLSCFGI